MDEIKIIQVKENVLASNEKEAQKLRNEMKKERTYLLNIMSSPGSGKTTLLKATIKALKDEMSIGVLEADIDSDVDAKAVKEAGADAIQLHTGGMCHLTADMTEQGISAFKDKKHYDLLFIENVGNLVCPAEFDTGATDSVVLMSVPEGDDKALKYPLMFEVCSAMVITKADVMPYFDFDADKCKKNALMRNKNLKIMEVSAKTGLGMDEWLNFLRNKVKIAKEGK